MKLSQAAFEKPLPGTIAGRRLQHTVRIVDKGILELEVVNGSWIKITTTDPSAVPHLIPMHRVASVQPLQESPPESPAKRRGRPPGSKNRKANVDRPSTETSVSSD